VIYAWDFDDNCASEIWFDRVGGINNGFKSCNSLRTDYQSRKCVTTADTRNYEEKTRTYYETKFNETQGIVQDPFMDTELTYELWHSTD